MEKRTLPYLLFIESVHLILCLPSVARSFIVSTKEVLWASFSRAVYSTRCLFINSTQELGGTCDITKDMLLEVQKRQSYSPTVICGMFHLLIVFHNTLLCFHSLSLIFSVFPLSLSLFPY